MDIKTQKMLMEAISGSKKNKVAPYSTTATVKSVLNDTIYVEIPGSENATPVKASSVSVKAGDVVDLVVSHADTHIIGNRSDVAVSKTEVNKVSGALEATRLEMDNTLDLVGNTIKMLNNDISMQDNKIEMQNNTIEMQNNTITEIGNTVNSQNNVIEQQNNTITEIGNTVNSQNNVIEQQNNTITEIGNKVNSQNNTITEIGNKINSQGNDITELNNKVNSQNNTITEIGNKVNSQGNTITELDNTVTEIGNAVNSQGNTITEIGNTVESQGNTITEIGNTIKLHDSSIKTLDSSIEIINSAFVIQDGKLTGISEIITNILDSGYVTTDLLNADVAWIENGKIKESAIGETEIADASITTAKVRDLSADVITSGTIRTERLILTTDEVDPDTGEKKVALITALNAKVNEGEGNILDGAVIADETIEAAKITVVDLNAFGATIGNFHIGTSSMYNGKTSLKDPTNGVYLGTDGIALGQGSLLGMTDDSPFRVESDGDFHLGAKDSNYINFNAFTGELDINAKTIKMGSKGIATSEDVTKAVDDIEIGGRNLIVSNNAVNGWVNSTGSVSGANGYKVSDYIPVTPGDTITFQLWTPSSVRSWIDDTYFDSDKNYVTGYNGEYITSNHIIKTYTIPEGVAYVRMSYAWATGYKVKLEKGNKATDWTPAPEDVDTKFEKYATLEVTNNKISTAVTETKKYADGKASDAVSTAKSYTDQTAASITSTVEGIDGRMTQMEQNADGFTWTIDKTAIVSSVNEYYKSDSATSLVGGSWSASQPPWEEGKYIWMQTKTTNGKGDIETSEPVCITGNTGAQGPQGPKGATGATGAPGQDANQIVHVAKGNGNSNMYMALATFTINGAYVNTPVQFKITSRGRESSNVYIMFASVNSADPGLSYIRADGEVPIWIQKTATSTWRLICEKNEHFGSFSISNYTNEVNISVTWTSEHLGSVPSSTDTNPVVKATRLISEQNASKVATNYMNFADNGLTIGNMTASTLGANVFIDSDSVDIRNGTNVLASYGENVNIKNSLIVNNNGVRIQGDDRVLCITNNDTTNMVDTMINDHTIVIIDTDINPLYSVELSTRTPLPGLTFNYGKSSEFKLTNTNMSFGSDNQFTIGDSSKRVKNIYTNDINLANDKYIYGTNTSGQPLYNIIPCHLNNRCWIGYGSYNIGEGGTDIYGNDIQLISNGATEVKGTFRVGSTSKISMWEDNEGGNIRIWAPDSCGNFWEVDAFNENLRFYTYDVNGTFQGCTISRGTGRIDKADKAWGVADYNRESYTIKIGYAGNGLTTTSHFAAYGTDSSGNIVIKDLSVANAQNVLGINTIKNTIAPLESWSYLCCNSTTYTSYGVNSFFNLNVASHTFYTSGASGVYSKGDDTNIYLAKPGTYLCLAKVCISGTKDPDRVKRLRGVFAGSECANSGAARLKSWETINTSFLLPISSAGYLTLQFQDESGSGTVYDSELQIFKIK